MTEKSAMPTINTAHRLVVGTADGLRVVDHDTGELIGGLAGPVTAVHTAASGDVWVLVDRRDLHRITETSSDLVATLDEGSVGACLGSHLGNVWVGGAGARLWRLGEGRLVPVDSFREAPTSDEWHTPWGGPPDVFSMASDGTDLFVSVHVGGILRTADSGASWTPTIDLHDDVHQVAIDGGGTIWAATGSRGLAESTDRGATWRYHTDGLHGHYLLAVATVDDGVLVAASSGHAARDGVIYRFDGNRFTRGDGLPDDLGGAVGPRRLAASGRDAVVSLPNSDLYRSGDGGRTWTRVAEDLPSVAEVALMPSC